MAGSDINQEHRPAQLQGCHPCPAVKRSPKSRQAESSRNVLRKGLPAGADLDSPQGHPAKKTHEAGKQETEPQDISRSTKTREALGQSGAGEEEGSVNHGYKCHCGLKGCNSWEVPVTCQCGGLSQCHNVTHSSDWLCHFCEPA